MVSQASLSMTALIYSLLITFATLNVAQNDEMLPTPKDRPKSVSELYGDYLKTEQRLWQRIRPDSYKSNETIIDVINSHRSIFFDDTFESNSYWRSFLIFGIENLRDHLSNINGTLETNYAYLFDADDKIVYDPSKIEQWTRESMFRHLRDNANGLFDTTVERKDIIFQHIQTEAKCCIRYVNYVISEAQLVREYYANVGKAVLRSYAMTQLANMLITIANPSNSRVADAQVEQRFFLHRYAQFREIIDSLFNHASRDLWKCNPNPYLDSHNYYTSVTNFMQGYVDNEVNLNDGHSCSGTCNDYKSAKNMECHNETLCSHPNFAKTRCTGDIFDCSTIDSDGSACLVKDEWENRRYNYIKFKNGSLNGHDVMCFKAEQTELASWSMWLVNRCSNCFCFCDEPGDRSDRFFSLKEATSNIDGNKIITGIALKKINRVIQFVISERELYAHGQVNDTFRRTHNWTIDGSNLLNDGLNGKDYFTLTREHRSINLDTIVLPLDKVLTGIRFQVHNNRLHMEIRATDFDYDTGKLRNIHSSMWIKNVNDEHRTQLNIDSPDSPTRTTNIQERFDSVNKFIEFRPSDIKKDLAQTTVPFIESVPLEANEPRPLSGAGLYYKGEPGFGGFIGIKLIAHETLAI